jgi:hypothetical protein
MNPNAYAISIPAIGNNSSNCFDPARSVNLAPNQRTTDAEMKSILGTSSPALPVPIVTCVYASASPPSVVGVTVDYTYEN